MNSDILVRCHYAGTENKLIFAGMTPFMWIASVAWICLASGYTRRKNRYQHVLLMCSGILLDLALVLYLEFTRDAVQTAMEFKLSVLKQLHIGFSTAALLLYFPVMFIGIKLLRGADRTRLLPLHKKFAVPALLLRTAGFIFMFSMWKQS